MAPRVPKPSALASPEIHRVGERYMARNRSIAFGRVPDHGTLILLDGTTVEFYYDTTAGIYGYFRYQGQGYKFPLHRVEVNRSRVWDLRLPYTVD